MRKYGNQKEMDLKMYPRTDMEGRKGLYCKECGTIFYAYPDKADDIRSKNCPVCGNPFYGRTTIRWIIPDFPKYQPMGRGFKCHAPA